MSGRRRRSSAFRVCIAAVLVTALTGRPTPAAAPGPTLPIFVTRKSVRAVDRGLAFLVKNQRADGSWASQGYANGYPVAMTSLAGLALMAGGSTPEAGPYARQVKRAMQYCLRVAKAGKSGLIARGGRSMHEHGFCMLFLAECYGVEASTKVGREIHDALTRAVDLTAKAQSDRGGWIYTPDGAGDEGSVTVTQLQALRACRNVGIKVPRSVIAKAVQYLKDCQNPDGGISYCYNSRGSSQPPISAAAIACFYAAGVADRNAATEEARTVERLVTYCNRRAGVDNYSGHYYYMHFYMAQAMYQRGGRDYKAYYPRIRDRLLALQRSDGAWEGDGVGRVYGTALACVVLQLPYGYLPIYQR